MTEKETRIRVGDEVRVRGGLPEYCSRVGLDKGEIYIIADIQPDYDEQYFAPLDEEIGCEVCEYCSCCEKVLHTDPVGLRLVNLATKDGKIITDKYNILWFERYLPNA